MLNFHLDDQMRINFLGYKIPLWQGCFTLLVLAYGIVILMTYTHYGITPDEHSHVDYGLYVLNWYTSLFKDRAAFSRVNVWLYGGWYDGLTAIACKISPLNVFPTRHLCNAGVGLLGVVAAYKLGGYLGGPWAGCLAALFLMLTPRYYGHAFNNHKDIPFAVSYLWSLYFLIRSVGRLPDLPRSWICKTALAIGITMGIRIGGVILWVPLLVSFIIKYVQAGLLKSRRAFLDLGASFAIQTVSIFLGAYVVMLAFWPWAQINPLVHPWKALRVFSGFPTVSPVFFEGRFVEASEFPWYYAPKWLLITLPEFLLIGLVLGAIAAWWTWPWKASSVPALERGVLVFGAVFPICYVVVAQTPLYDGIRHILFVVPPLAVLSAIGTRECVRRLKGWKGYGTALLSGSCLLLTLWEMVSMHPNQYVYFNHLFAGGIEKAWTRYETDYWDNSYKQGVRWIDTHYADLIRDLGLTRLPRIASGASSTQHLLDPRGFEYVENPFQADLYLITTRLEGHTVLPGEIIHTVRTQGAPLLYVIRPDSSYRGDPFFSGSSVYRNLHKGFLYEKADKKEWALEAYRKGLEVDPQNVSLHKVTGALYLESKQYDLALNHLSAALRLGPPSAGLYTDIATSYENLGRYEDATSFYQKALGLHPYFMPAHRGLARRFENSGRYQEAAYHMERVLEIVPESLGDLHRMGSLMKETGQLDRAEEIYREVADRVPESVKSLVFFNLGLVFLEGNKYDDAIAVFQKAIEIQPDFVLAYLNLGTVLEQLGRLKEAGDVMGKLVSIDVEEYEAWFVLAKIHRRLGDMDEAYRAIRIAVEGDATDTIYQNEYFNIGKAFEMLGKVDQAKAIYESVIDSEHQGSQDRLRELGY